jgi:hypothetical protein
MRDSVSPFFFLWNLEEEAVVMKMNDMSDRSEEGFYGTRGDLAVEKRKR